MKTVNVKKKTTTQKLKDMDSDNGSYQRGKLLSSFLSMCWHLMAVLFKRKNKNVIAGFGWSVLRKTLPLVLKRPYSVGLYSWPQQSFSLNLPEANNIQVHNIIL